MILHDHNLLGRYYDNNLLVQYNVYCGEDEEAVYNIPFLDVQGANECHEDGEPRFNNAVHLTLTKLKDLCSINRCIDYILIDSEAEERTEMCGNSTKDSTTFVNSNALTVIFRSSESYSFRGFQMRIACLGQENSCDMQGSQYGVRYCLCLMSDMFCRLPGFE